MKIRGRKVLVLGGYGLVGTAVCRELIERGAGEIQIHSLRRQECEEARQELAAEAGETTISLSHGDIFGPSEPTERLDRIGAQLVQLEDGDLPAFLLYRQLQESRPDVVVDCVNTATAIAYSDVYRAAETLWRETVEDRIDTQSVTNMLEALYVPRLIRHIQVLYRGLLDAAVGVYVKVGTSGTGGMGLNVPYTHSEEKPSRVLLSKSAMAGAHSMLLFLMARTPGAPFIKEIKPAAAIAWKKIGRGPIRRKGRPLRLVEAEPRPLPERFSTVDPTAGRLLDESLETVFIDTGENGLFSLEEFALLTTARQMEFVTPEEIARLISFEIEGGNTGHDIVNALDNAVLGPTYRAGLMRHWALERMMELEEEGATRSVAFEMLGPPRNSKLLFEAHLLREAFVTMTAVRDATPEEVAARLVSLLEEKPRLASEILAVGLPVLLPSGEILRGPEVIVPARCEEERVTPERLETWAEAGWVDLRAANCARWIERFRRIHEEVCRIPPEDTSSRYLRHARFWDEAKRIQPGKIVGWILSVEEQGARFKR
jgi:NAD(P)-dependent dehydrogenase (short-subunit alcohol dehydrogenase family)